MIAVDAGIVAIGNSVTVRVSAVERAIAAAIVTIVDPGAKSIAIRIRAHVAAIRNAIVVTIDTAHVTGCVQVVAIRSQHAILAIAIVIQIDTRRSYFPRRRVVFYASRTHAHEYPGAGD